MTRCYLDHAATTPMRPEALAAMAPWLAGRAGNAASLHQEGQEAAASVKLARARIAALVGALPEDVLLTSGATEASNMALRGASHPRRHGGRHLVTTPVEHAATRAPLEAMAGEGWQVHRLPVDAAGRVVEDGLRRLIGHGTAIVSVIAGHNELGTVQPLHALAEAAHAVGALLHLDAVQAAPYLDLADVPWDLLTLSAHKLGGPQGVGALVRRGEVPLAPLLLGGSQQRGLRPGTVPVALAVGFGAAAEAALVARRTEAVRLAGLREAFAERLADACPGLVPLGARALAPEAALPHVLSYGLDGLAGDEVVYALDQAGIAAASASACLSGARSPTLDAIGAAPELAMVRFSLGWTSREAEVLPAAARAAAAIASLRAQAPFERRAGIFMRTAADAEVVLQPPHWEAARAVFDFHAREGVLPGARVLARLLPGGPALDALFPYGLSTLCAWLGLPIPQGGCRPYMG